MSAEPEFVPLTVEELQVYFPQYEIQSFIAAGGMGAVYSANQKSIDRQVAIKVLPREMSSDEEFSAQFRAEAKVMSRVNHPNLVGFFDFGEVDGMLFIVMEFVGGKSLHHSAHGEVIDPKVALGIIIGIAEGVNHAHEAGILHRDIKPANVLLDQKATPKLGDFGLARPVEESEEGKVVFGTPGYTAPEVVNNPAAIDERADIFSLGAILYELLTGHLPGEKYVAPSSEFDLHKDFDKIVKKAILPDPDLRYPDMEEFLVDLKALKGKLEAGEDEDDEKSNEGSSKSVGLATPGLKSGAGTRGVAKRGAPKVAKVQTPATLSKPLATSMKKGQSPVVTKYDKKKAEKSKLINIAVTGAIIAMGAVFIFSKVLKGKQEANQPEQEVKIVEILSKDTETEKQPEVIVKTNVEKLDELRDQLEKHEFSKFPEGAFTVDSCTYFFYDEPQTWMNAQKEAERYGGYLACPSTVALTENFATEIEKYNSDEVWTGGGTFDGRKMSWINGDKWHFKSFTPDKQGALSFNKTGDFQISPHKELKQFFICWDLSGTQRGEVHNQLSRIREAAKENNFESVPPRVFIESGSIYYVYLRRTNFKEANRIAEKYGAEIALPRNDRIYKRMCMAVYLALQPGASAWIAGEVKKNGLVNWDAKLDNNKIWLEELVPSENNRAIRVVNNSVRGLKSFDKTAGAEALILEWKIK